MWEKIKVNSYNPITKKPEEFLVEGINKDGLIISRAAEFAIVVEKQVIRNLIVKHLNNLEKQGLVKNVENQLDISALDFITFFTFKDREILLLPPMMGAPLIECIVQDSHSMGVEYIVRLGTTGSLTKDIPMYSFIATTEALRHDATSDHYLPHNVPANPDKDLHNVTVKSFREKGILITEGVSYTTSTRFKEDVPQLLNLNKKDDVLNIEMESATLFSVAKVLNMKSASVSMVTDCLADEEELENVEGTLVGIPKYQDYVDKGLTTLVNAFEAILEGFSNMPNNSSKFIELKNRISLAKKTQTK